MSVWSSHPEDPWIPTPFGFNVLTSAIEAIRHADRAELMTAGCFSMIILIAALIAAAAGGPAFDHGGILGAAG